MPFKGRARMISVRIGSNIIPLTDVNYPGLTSFLLSSIFLLKKTKVSTWPNLSNLLAQIFFDPPPSTLHFPLHLTSNCFVFWTWNRTWNRRDEFLFSRVLAFSSGIDLWFGFDLINDLLGGNYYILRRHFLIIGFRNMKRLLLYLHIK